MQDYAKKRQPQAIEKPDGRSWLNTLMLVLAFIFALAGIIHFAEKQDTRRHDLEKPVAAIQPETPAQKPIMMAHHAKPRHALQKNRAHHHAANHKKTTLAANIQPKYDFYKLLPEMTVTVPAPATTSTH